MSEFVSRCERTIGREQGQEQPEDTIYSTTETKQASTTRYPSGERATALHRSKMPLIHEVTRGTRFRGR